MFQDFTSRRPGAFVAVTAVLALLSLAGPASLRADSLDDAVRALEKATDEEILKELRRRYELRKAVPPSLDKSVRGRDVKTGLGQYDDATLARAVRTVSGRGRVLYGPDDRKDWSDIADPEVKRLATASVALFASADLQPDGAERVRLRTRPLGEIHGLCADETFATQPSGAFCSGTLVKDDVVLTAGHCVRELSADPEIPYINAVSFVFSYRVETAGAPAATAIPRAQVFKGRQVLTGELAGRRGKDWALVRLDRAVPASLATPVTRRRAAPAKVGDGVYVIGYPSGLPLKYAPGAIVRDASDPVFFTANLDTFGGNSGSGVFDAATHELAGVLVRGDTDYVRYEGESCVRAYECPTSGCRGEDVTRISLVPQP